MTRREGHYVNAIADATSRILLKNDPQDPEFHLSLAPCQVIGFFPGLGSREFYRDAGTALLETGSAEVVEILRSASAAYGDATGDPRSILLTAANIPTDPLERQSFIGASFLAHSLALEADARTRAAQSSLSVEFSAYTGESFGVLASAVASGALSIWAGVRIARAFTPLMLMVGRGQAGEAPLGLEFAPHLPTFETGHRPVDEDFHVIALTADPESLERFLREMAHALPAGLAEAHKIYSSRQANLYVAASAVDRFRAFAGRHPAVTSSELKKPTRFLAHSGRMAPAREALENFMDAERIIFRTPTTPVISNHDSGLLTTAEQIRDGVLAMTDRVMQSLRTVEMIDEMQADVVLELGLGGKSLLLFADNSIETPAGAYTGSVGEGSSFLQSVELGSRLQSTLSALAENRAEFGDEHLALLRQIFDLSAEREFHDRYFGRIMRRAIKTLVLKPGSIVSAAFLRFVEIFQQTKAYEGHVDRRGGALVMSARVKKRLSGPLEEIGHAYAELEVVDAAGETRNVVVPEIAAAEAVVFHFARPQVRDDVTWAKKVRRLLESQPTVQDDHAHLLDASDPRLVEGEAALDRRAAIDLLVLQHSLFDLVRLYRPALLAETDHYLEGGDRLGWLVALAAAGSIDIADAVDLAASALTSPPNAARVQGALGTLLPRMKAAGIPVIGPSGSPLTAPRDLQSATAEVFLAGALDDAARPIRLGGTCHVLSLGSELLAEDLDTRPHPATVLSVVTPSDIWKKRVNAALHNLEEKALLASTKEYRGVLAYARNRKLLASSVYAYVDPGETVVGFGAGGSESMTIFLRRPGDAAITVRKVLSDALTTVSWDSSGTGVMLPPFAKAKKQAEYLQALPDSVTSSFPRVAKVDERVIPVPGYLRTGSTETYSEVIYEMSFVPGEEVSRFVERAVPPPAVLARLYEVIFTVLHRDIHTLRRRPVSEPTLEEQYFRKIEDRLDLCRATAPRTFGADLLDTEHIIIDGVRYLNHRSLLRRFRENPRFLAVLEPRFHSLVMGDTNTENIKIGRTDPLVAAQALIERAAPQAEIAAALAAITATSIELMFLDPRAIGFRSDGADTRDDPMYDNKPWHNSLGHYDEIHFEHFQLTVTTAAGVVPAVDVDFIRGNPFQRAYRVRDVTARGGSVDPHGGEGMEDHFASVMSAVYGEDDVLSLRQDDDPNWLVRFVFVMGTHFTAMPPFHFQSELDGSLTDTPQTQRRPIAIYCEGIKWLNWAVEMLEGSRTEFLGIPVPKVL
jgi:hypothetical protein